MLLVPAFQMGKFICVSGIKYILILAICLDETRYCQLCIFFQEYQVFHCPVSFHGSQLSCFLPIYDTFWHLFWHCTACNLQLCQASSSSVSADRQRTVGESQKSWKKRLPVSYIKLKEKGVHSVKSMLIFLSIQGGSQWHQSPPGPYSDSVRGRSQRIMKEWKLKNICYN